MTQDATGDGAVVDGAEAVDDDAPIELTGIEITRKRSAEFFVTFRDEELSEAARTMAREDLVRLHLPLVEHCARRFLQPR
ncbi:hypothetical protein [Nocardioides sp. B-3]|uniref:hypothetical protein n=1 Tax=Nocardioides sp. B-3 TaxID=2895565 RepID=UPI0021527630|nr:hypothetical protein [Nocardioides sp. B-3]UUZ58322.1 hypothetical protein LP418_19185 [Nocardioides sp. B-3]